MTWSEGDPIVVDSERYRMRLLAPQDASEVYLAWWNDAELQQGFNQRARNWTLEDARRHIASFDRKHKFHFGISAKSDGTLIGFFSIFREGAEGEVAFTNICLGERAHQGQQAALEVKKAMLSFMFSAMGIRRIEGRVIGRNLSSMAVYHGLGFAPEGVLRAHAASVQGGRADVYLFGVLKEEWRFSHVASLQDGKSDSGGVAHGAREEHKPLEGSDSAT